LKVMQQNDGREAPKMTDPIKEFLEQLPAMMDACVKKPKEKPKLATASESSVSLETQHERLGRAQRRLMEEERALVRESGAEHNRRAFAEQRARAEAEAMSPQAMRNRIEIERWYTLERESRRHRRWLERNNYAGIYEVQPFHGSERE
jgi:hypothetical protein